MTTSTRPRYTELTGAGIGRPLPGSDGTRSISDLVDQATGLRDVYRLIGSSVESLPDRAMLDLVDTKSRLVARRSPAELADTLGESYGFAWRDVARMASVSVPALRKWRMGETASPANQLRLARVVALCEVIEEKCPDISDVASWFELPEATNQNARGRRP